MTKKIKIKFLAIALLICTAGVISSCYYDYGIDPDSSNVVVTLYDNTYDFSTVKKYYLIDTVQVIGSGTLSNTYQSTIIPTMKTNLDALNWTQTTIRDSADVIVGAGVTSSTIVVNEGYDYWGYYGYSWYYPYYGGYTYSYTTGTLIMLMSDPSKASGTTLPAVWTGVLNGAAGQSTPTATLITTGIDQAFSQSQSPYLH